MPSKEFTISMVGSYPSGGKNNNNYSSKAEVIQDENQYEKPL